MAVTEITSGTQTCVISSEHTLTTLTDDAVYTLVLDLNNIVGGTTPDILEVRIKRRALTGGTTRQQIVAHYVGGLLPNKVVESPPIVVIHSAEVSIKQTQGTGRAVDWSIRKIA